jgi:predicted amidophosphoribosyltransferase
MPGPRLYCPVCGQLVPPPGRGCPNRWCRRTDREFSVAYAAGVYEGALGRAIRRYKYGGERQLVGTFARMLASFLRSQPAWFEEFDLITAVPAYTGPDARRPWDPAGDILRALGTSVGREWAVEPGLVTKAAETPGMTGLGWGARQAVATGPLRSSLRFDPRRSVEGAQVLVFDDVLTEGSTLREVARLLRRHGASDVAGLVLARPGWEPVPPRAGRPAGR